MINFKVSYNYEKLKKHIYEFKSIYPFIEIGSIGKSILNKELFFVKLGDGPNKVLYNGSHHGIEWITTPILMNFIQEYSIHYKNNIFFKGYDLKQLFKKHSIYIIPMVNPDGVDLVLNGLKENNPYFNKLVEYNKGTKDFSKNWKSNIRGVDLNRNYPALWEKSSGANKPGPLRYKGKIPLSEPETQALVQFTRKINPALTLSYHSQGRVIYWNFQNMATKNHKEIGLKLAKESSYYLDVASGLASYGGYKDWFIKEFKRPGYTIEVGKGKNPLPLNQFDTIYNNNEGLLLLASTYN